MLSSSGTLLLQLLVFLVAARILVHLWQRDEGGGQLLRGDISLDEVLDLSPTASPTPRPSRGPTPPPTPINHFMGDYDFSSKQEVLLPTAHRRAERVARHCKAVQLDLLRPPNRKPRNGFEFGRWWQDNWEPTWACPLEERIQKRDPLSNELSTATSLADGGKWVCDPIDTLARRGRKCLVYSFGSNGEFSFEYGLDDRLQGNAEIHTFDPFVLEPGVAPNTSSNLFTQAELQRREIWVHPMGLAATDFDTPPLAKWNQRVAKMRSLPSIAQTLNHTNRLIDILKVDIDGGEYSILGNSSWWKELDASGLKIGQLLLEIHFNPVSPVTFRFRDERGQWVKAKTGPEVDALFRVLHEQGFVLFHKEINLIGKPPNDAGEFAFLRLGDLNCSSAASTAPL